MGLIVMRSLLLIIFFSVTARAAVRPTVKAWKDPSYKIGGEKGKTASKYIEDLEARLKKADCRKSYAEAQKTYLAAEKKLKDLVAKKAGKQEIREAHKELKNLRNIYLNKMELAEGACGDCITPPVRLIEIDDGLVPEYWYESHGFCTVKNLKQADVLAGYDELIAFLGTPNKYNYRDGGFRAILEFLGVDNKTKKPLPDLGPVGDGDFYGFMAVRANILGNAYAAFHYFIKNTVTKKKTEKGKVFDLTFHESPKGDFVIPQIKGLEETGEESKPFWTKPLPRIVGWWYIDTELGVIRYSTAAQFPFKMPQSEKIARRAHLETMATVRERFFEVSPVSVERDDAIALSAED